MGGADAKASRVRFEQRTLGPVHVIRLATHPGVPDRRRPDHLLHDQAASETVPSGQPGHVLVAVLHLVRLRGAFETRIHFIAHHW